MKTNMWFLRKVFAVFSAMAVTATVAQAGIVYNNSTNFIGQFFGTTNEFGDQIALAGDPLERVLETFKFEYFLSRAPSGDEQVQFKIYANNGVGGAPGDVLYQFDQPLSLAGNTGYRTVEIPNIHVPVPDIFTWTVQFTGVTDTEQVGLLFYDPPTVGSSFDDYWEYADGAWTTKRFSTSGGPVANFGAQATAVPELSTLQYALMSGLAFMGLSAYRRIRAK
jgi:hypothetical protein